MRELTISLSNQIQYKFYGLFEAPSDNWVHMSRTLEEYQLILVTKGTLFIANQNRKYTINAGEYIMMEPGLQYGYHPSACSFYWLHFTMELSTHAELSQFTLPMQGTLCRPQRLSVLFSQLNDMEITYHNTLTTNFYATSILLELANQIQNPEKIPLSNEDRLHQNILSYIKWNTPYLIKVKDIAAHFGYHPKYLSTVFHQKHGISLKQYLIEQTMEYAKDELSHSNRQIQDIALGLGYSDSHAFSHAFRHSIGVTPSEYRLTHPKMDINNS